MVEKGVEKGVEEGERNESEGIYDSIGGLVDNSENNTNNCSKISLSPDTVFAEASDKINIGNENTNNLTDNADSGSCIPESEDFVVPPIGRIYYPRSVPIIYVFFFTFYLFYFFKYLFVFFLLCSAPLSFLSFTSLSPHFISILFFLFSPLFISSPPYTVLSFSSHFFSLFV
jgi:hypothetical protein